MGLFGSKGKDTEKAADGKPTATGAAQPISPATASPQPSGATTAPQIAAMASAAPTPPAGATTTPLAAGELQGSADTPLSPEEKEQQAHRVMGAKMVAASFGEIISILMRSPAYKHFSLADLEWLVVPPVLTQQFVLAEARKGKDGIPAPIAVALWASVSEEVDKKLSANLNGPLRLRPDEWKSGDTLWLIDAVGPPKVVNGLIENLHKNVFKGQSLKVRSRGEDGKPMVKVQKLGEASSGDTGV